MRVLISPFAMWSGTVRCVDKIHQVLGEFSRERSHGWKAVGSLRLLKLQGHLEGAADAVALWGQAEMLHFGKGSQWGK